MSLQVIGKEPVMKGRDRNGICAVIVMQYSFAQHHVKQVPCLLVSILSGERTGNVILFQYLVRGIVRQDSGKTVTLLAFYSVCSLLVVRGAEFSAFPENDSESFCGQIALVGGQVAHRGIRV